MRWNSWLAVGTLSLAVVGCAPKQKGTYEVADASSEASASEALKAEADALWEQRSDEAQLKAALQKYEAAYEADPRNRETAAQLTRGWYFLGDAHLDDKDAKMAAWDTAINWGKRCLAINEAFRAKVEAGEKEIDAVAVATKEDVPCLYWMASALGKWAKLNGIAASLKYKDTIVSYVTRVGELDPTYFHGAPDRYWGAYYSVIPSFAGQDLGRSKTHFDKSLAVAPDYLGTKVLLAENWAVKTQDRTAFEQALKDVLAADATAIPEIAAENLAEQEKARRLLEQADELFR